MPASGMTLQALLDELQAAEEAGAEALGLWLATCDDPALRGGLRVIRARDIAHARLARRRLEAIGATPGQAAPRQLQSLCGVLAASDVSNRSKLTILLSRFPARADDPVPDVVRQLDDDETRAMLESIHDDDRASLRWLRDVGEVLAPGPAIRPAPDASMVRFLDAYRAAERAAADVVGAWRDVCRSPGLRGGLDTIAAREATHAELLEARVQELGGVPGAHVDDAVRERAHAHFGAADVSDDSKLARALARYADDAAVTAPLDPVIAEIAGDQETREMLRLVAAGEHATFAWLRSYWHAVSARPREVSLRILDGGR